jgi:hypothetical protein
MDPDQTARMRRLVWIHAGHKPIILVLSWLGSTNPITNRETDSGQHGSWSECSDVQAGLDPCWSQTHYVGFVVTRLIYWFLSLNIIFYVVIQHIAGILLLLKLANLVRIIHFYSVSPDYHPFPASFNNLRCHILATCDQNWHFTVIEFYSNNYFKTRQNYLSLFFSPLIL